MKIKKRRSHRCGYVINLRLKDEQPFVLSRVPKGFPVGRSTLYDLITRGKIAPNTGELVKLECMYNGSICLMTSAAAYDRFTDSINGKSVAPSIPLMVTKPNLKTPLKNTL